jgi:hypothetical protein
MLVYQRVCSKKWASWLDHSTGIRSEQPRCETQTLRRDRPFYLPWEPLISAGCGRLAPQFLKGNCHLTTECFVACDFLGKFGTEMDRT